MVEVITDLSLVGTGVVGSGRTSGRRYWYKMFPQGKGPATIFTIHDKHQPIAECHDLHSAEKIVDALNGD